MKLKVNHFTHLFSVCSKLACEMEEKPTIKDEEKPVIKDEPKSMIKDEREASRQVAARNIMETLVRHRPSLSPETLYEALKQAFQVEHKIFKLASTQQALYWHKVCLKLVQLERKQPESSPPTGPEANHDLPPEELRRNLRRKRFGEIMRKLSSESGLKTSDHQLAHQDQEYKFRKAHIYRLKQPDAEDVSHPKSISPPDPGPLFESRDLVWPKVLQLRVIYLPELMNIRDVLSEALRMNLRHEQMCHIISWLEVLGCIILNLTTPKQDLPEKFRRGTIRCLERHVKSTSRFFRDCLPEAHEYVNAEAGDTSSVRDPSASNRLDLDREADPYTLYWSESPSSDGASSSRGSHEEYKPPFASFSAEAAQEITRFLVDLYRIRAIAIKRRDEVSTSTEGQKPPADA